MFLRIIMNIDEKYIYRCIELASKAKGDTYPNPMVGAVIVHCGKIIGEGYHKKAGQPHAEINAIASVQDKSLLSESTIYVSLEPCSHFGKTPPCALELRVLNFKKVVIGTMDTNEKVSGRGKRILEEAGIEVVSDILGKECRELNKRFFTFHEKKRPYIILKWTESADGFLDKDFQPTQISNALASQWVHKMRSEEHAILVGTKTALNDNPSLTTRHYKGRNPIRILVDYDLKVPVDFNIYDDASDTIIINSHKDDIQNLGRVKNVFVRAYRDSGVLGMMEVLYKQQIQSLIVEGGRFTLQEFLAAGLWDEMVVIRNKNLMLGSGTPVPRIEAVPQEIKTIGDNEIAFYYQ